LRGGVEREIVYLERDNNMERKESTWMKHHNLTAGEKLQKEKRKAIKTNHSISFY
jgi:hypothetical protein